jgi:prophage regulatory protein
LVCVFDWRKHSTKEMEMAIKRMSDVLKAFGYRSRTTVYKNVNAGVFTRPISIGVRAVGWLDTEIEAISVALAAGKNQTDIQALVDKLHARRISSYNSVLEGGE